jgi:hypothetical protein
MKNSVLVPALWTWAPSGGKPGHATIAVLTPLSFLKALISTIGSEKILLKQTWMSLMNL